MRELIADVLKSEVSDLNVLMLALAGFLICNESQFMERKAG